MTWIILVCYTMLCSMQQQESIVSCEPQASIAYDIVIQDKQDTTINKVDNSNVDVLALLRQYTTLYDYDYDLAERIMYCESWWRPNATNRAWSSAWGLFQFLDSTRASNSKRYWFAWYSKFDAEANIAVAIQKLKNEWTNAWRASQHCWWI